MSFLSRFTRPAADSPLTLRMTLVPENVQVGLYCEDRLLMRREALASVPKLPDAVLRYIKPDVEQPKQPGKSSPQAALFLLMWPQAKALCDTLRANPANKLQLACDDVESLVVIERPASFEIRWLYNPSWQRLDRYLIDADLHLGMGWFKKDHTIWQVDPTFNEVTNQWISASQISGADIFTFVARFIPAVQRANWPFSCDLKVLERFSVQLNIVRTHENAIDVRLLGNVPGVLDTLQILDGDDRNMLSGDYLLPNLRPAISDRLLNLAHQSVKRFYDDNLAEFIQDDLRPRAVLLGVDMQQIDEKYPVYNGDQLNLSWQLEPEVQKGIGVFQAVPYLTNGLIKLPLATMLTEVANVGSAHRFYRIEKGWLDLTRNFRVRLNNFKLAGLSTFRLTPPEMLGSRSGRLRTAQLQAPDFSVPYKNTEPALAGQFLDTLRRYGVPGGFSGLQADTAKILSGVCGRLLKDAPDAAILWVVPQKKRPVAADLLRQENAPYDDAEHLKPTQSSGRVTLTSPGIRAELASEWTLIILQDLDILAFSEMQINFFSRLSRLWTVATFSRDTWSQDNVRLTQSIRAVGLEPENIPIFIRKCVMAYSDQSENSKPAPFTSPFSKVLSAHPDTAGGTPIPPLRKTQPHLPAVPPSLPELPPGFDFKFHPELDKRSSLTLPPVIKESFVVQARRYVDRFEKSATEVPFSSYYPTYDKMTPAQERWYFYWRYRLRQGDWKPTDLSYLMVHIYEGISLVGFSSAPAAFDHLVAIWKHYRAAQPNLDRYLVDWLADFVVVYQQPLTALNWYNQAQQIGAVIADFDLNVEAWLQGNNGDLSGLPNDILYRLTDYSPVKNKFYQEHNQNNRLDLAYRKGIQAIDALLRGEHQSLLKLYRPAPDKMIKREPFAGALHDMGHQTITIASIAPWSGASILALKLTSIIKYTENILRKQANFKSRLQGIDLPLEWQRILNQTFAIQIPRREIKLDMSNVVALKRQSDELQQRLIVEDSANKDKDSDLNQTSAQENAVPATTNEPPLAPSPSGINYTELSADWAVFAHKMKPQHWQALAILIEQADVTAQLNTAAQRAGSTPSRLIDELNEFALDSIGDIVINAENNPPQIETEDRNDLQTLLAWADRQKLLEY